jgi:NAD(P)-dependent dehydrogenase (short-subunit alcohol dehydrogenase family)
MSEPLETMQGKIVFITVATSGIGKEAAHELARLGATIVFTTRDIKRGERVKDELVRSTQNAHIEWLFCDLASFDSIRACCEDFKKTYTRLDVLVNNAGVLDFTRCVSKDGIENIFATNYLAPFLLTSLFLDVIKKSSPSRIINVASAAHHGVVDFDDLESKQRFSGMNAYRQSKLCLILFTRFLADQLYNTGVTVNCVHPGFISTRLMRDAGVFSRMYYKIRGQNPRAGAQPIVYLASSSDVSTITGEYFNRTQIERTTKETYDMDMAKKLWDRSRIYVRL